MVLKIFSGEFWAAFLKLLLGLASFSFLAVFIPVQRFNLVPDLTTDALLLALGGVVFFTSLLLAWLAT